MIMYAIILSTIAILTHNTTAITMLTMHHVTITTKTIAVQTLILEDVADIEDNILNMTEGAVTKQPLKSKKLLVDYMKSTNNFFVFLSKKGPEGPFSLV